MSRLAGVEMTKPTSRDVDRMRPSLRQELRSATQGVHDRLHLHAGFAAVQHGTVRPADYRNLITRLYGFYVPFEAAMGMGIDRSTWLANDLAALGVAHLISAVPKCPHIPDINNADRRLGAGYVAEGSALGGRELARGLDPMLGIGVTDGRQFFIGRGAGTGEAWLCYLTQLSAASDTPSVRAEIVTGAVEMFAAFEKWLNGWSTASHG